LAAASAAHLTGAAPSGAVAAMVRIRVGVDADTSAHGQAAVARALARDAHLARVAPSEAVAAMVRIRVGVDADASAHGQAAGAHALARDAHLARAAAVGVDRALDAVVGRDVAIGRVAATGGVVDAVDALQERRMADGPTRAGAVAVGAALHARPRCL